MMGNALGISGQWFPQLGENTEGTQISTLATALAQTVASFSCLDSELASASLPPECSLNAESPFVAPYLKSPTGVFQQTFGHQYSWQKPNQAGGRYRHYTGAATNLAIASGMAVDRETGVTFYTQSAKNTGTFGSGTTETPTYAAFTRTPELKFQEPIDEGVWIVVVY
jgi:hypothetical protein